jgi:hypothetical protein
MEQVNKVPAVISREIYTLLKKSSGKFISTPKRSLKFCKVQVGGRRVRVNWSAGNLNAVETIQRNGPSMITDPRMSRI